MLLQSKWDAWQFKVLTYAAKKGLVTDKTFCLDATLWTAETKACQVLMKAALAQIAMAVCAWSCVEKRSNESEEQEKEKRI